MRLNGGLLSEGKADKIQAEIDKWEGRLYTMTNMKSSSNSSDPKVMAKRIASTEKKIEALKRKLAKDQDPNKKMLICKYIKKLKKEI